MHRQGVPFLNHVLFFPTKNYRMYMSFWFYNSSYCSALLQVSSKAFPLISVCLFNFITGFLPVPRVDCLLYPREPSCVVVSLSHARAYSTALTFATHHSDMCRVSLARSSLLHTLLLAYPCLTQLVSPTIWRSLSLFPIALSVPPSRLFCLCLSRTRPSFFISESLRFPYLAHTLSTGSNVSPFRSPLLICLSLLSFLLSLTLHLLRFPFFVVSLRTYRAFAVSRV